MRVNFQVLTYFLAIANEESITAACEVLLYGMKNSSFQDDALLKTSFLPG